jgi:Rod binding domain-containing protein
MADASLPLPGAPLPIAAAPRNLTPDQAAPEQLRRAAQEFESVFLSEMLAPMFEGLDSDGLGGGGMGEQIFRPMLVERYAEAITHAGGVGIAESVVREMLRMQSAPATEAGDGADR